MQLYNSAFYRIDFELHENRVHLTQVIRHPVIHTAQLPTTHTVLSKYIPSIFGNLCFNDKKQSFAREAKNTETGHLFEHLILEFMKLETEKTGIAATFDGVTSWDWSKYGKGTYHIELRYKRAYHKYFYTSFENSVRILNLLYNSAKRNVEAKHNLPSFRQNAPLPLAA